MKVKIATQTLSRSIAEDLLFLCNNLNVPEFHGVEPTLSKI